MRLRGLRFRMFRSRVLRLRVSVVEGGCGEGLRFRVPGVEDSRLKVWDVLWPIILCETESKREKSE